MEASIASNVESTSECMAKQLSQEHDHERKHARDFGGCLY